MPRGNKNLGSMTGVRFTKENAREMGARGNAAKQANAPIRKCLKNIATTALYGHPPLSNEQLKPVAKFFGIKVDAVTFAELAIYKQVVAMAKGDQSALNLVAAYAGEKPADHYEITTGDYSALDAAIDRMGGEDD